MEVYYCIRLDFKRNNIYRLKKTKEMTLSVAHINIC